jgi:hypothetical protein
VDSLGGGGEAAMPRRSFDPQDFGIDLTKDEFLDRMVDAFNDAFRGSLSLDELLLHPREALRFCDDVRFRYGFFGLPDDIILRALMQRRKNPEA